MTPFTHLPVMTTDNMVGIVWVFTRSYENATVSVWQVVCPMQGTPTQVTPVGNFRPADLLNWVYGAMLCESGQFEAPTLWSFMASTTDLDPMEMLAFRPMLGTNLEAIQKLVDLDADQLQAMFPPITRAA